MQWAREAPTVGKCEEGRVHLNNRIKLPGIKKRRTSYYPIYVILGVVVLLFAVLRLFPIFKVFYMSLFNWNMATGKKLFIGFTNFANMFSNPTFTAAMLRTIYMGFEILLITVPLALLIANAINKNFGKKTKAIIQTGLFIPYIVPMVPTVIIWKWLFNTKYGLVNYVLNLFGGASLAWLTNGFLAEQAIVIITVWKNLGYCVLIFCVGLAGIPQMYYEAAELDGSSPWKTFWHITLPQLRPVLIYVSIIMLIRGFNVYTQAYILCSDASGSPGYVVRTVVYDMVENGFKFYKMGYAAAESVALFAFMFLFSFIQFVFGDEEKMDAWKAKRRQRKIRQKGGTGNA